MDFEELEVGKRLGLSEMDREGKVFRCSLKGGHLEMSKEEIYKLIVNFGDHRNRDYERGLEELEDICRFTRV